MPRGGIRVGQGRRPQPKTGVVLGLDTGRRVKPVASLPELPAVERETLLVPPEDLTAEAKAYWMRWAPAAIEERTLTLATASGFRELCEQYVLTAAVYARILLLGPTTIEAAPYLRNYIQLAQRLDGTLARFKLTAFGKPAVSDKPKAAANPWAQVVGK